MPLLKQSKIILFGGSGWFRVHGEGKAAHGFISPPSIRGWQEDRASPMTEDDMPVLISVQGSKREILPGGRKGGKIRVKLLNNCGECKPVL